MKIRLIGLPAEITQAFTILQQTQILDVLQAAGPYPDRGDSRQVRLYFEAQLRADHSAVP